MLLIEQSYALDDTALDRVTEAVDEGERCGRALRTGGHDLAMPSAVIQLGRGLVAHALPSLTAGTDWWLAAFDSGPRMPTCLVALAAGDDAP